MTCPRCEGVRWVCENHPAQPWDESLATGCECGAGMPCENCNGGLGMPAHGPGVTERYPPIAYAPPERPSDPRRGVRLYDARDVFDELVPWLRKRKRIRTNWRGRPVYRKHQEVRLLMLHQMAVSFGREGQAFADRAARTAYHMAVSDDGGEVAILKPLLTYANHGGHANGPSIGLGVEGTYPGEASRRGRKHTPITPGLEAGIRLAMERALEECDLEALIAHRQSSAQRRGDPGEELWTIGADVARSLGLRVDLTTTWDDGRMIPWSWSGVPGVRY